MVKVTHQVQGHIKVKVKNLHPSNFMYPILLCKRMVCIRLKCVLVLFATTLPWHMCRGQFLFTLQPLEFFLNGAKLSTEFSEFRETDNHRSMNWAQFKVPVSHMCCAGTVVACWSLTQEVAG